MNSFLKANPNSVLGKDLTAALLATSSGGFWNPLRGWATGTGATLLACLPLAANPLQVLRLGAESEVHALAFSKDGNQLAVSSARMLRSKPGFVEAGVGLWNIKTAELSRTLRQAAWTDGDETDTGTYVVGALEYSPDDRALMATDHCGFVQWEPQTGQEKFRWRSGVSAPELSPAWSSDGKWLVLPSMSQDRFGVTNGLALVDASTGTRRFFLPEDRGYARTARFFPGGRYWATVGHNCELRVVDMVLRTNVFVDPLPSTLWAVSFSPNGRQLVVGPSYAGVLVLYDVAEEHGRLSLKQQGVSWATRSEIHSVEFTPDSRRALTSSNEGLRIWWTDRWQKSVLIPGCTGRLSGDGHRVALVHSARPGVIEIWDLDELARSRPSPLLTK